jgi:hypothetical protein
MTLSLRGFPGFSSAAISYALIASMVGLASGQLQAQGRSPAQGQVAGSGRVENTQVVVTGGLVSITYDLVSSSTPPATFEVRLEASQNGGRTYEPLPKTVRGDVGPGVAPGSGKTVVWEAAKDTDNLQLGQFRFLVAIKAEPARAGQLDLSPRSLPEPEKQPVAGGTRKGFLGAGIGMLGLGGFWVAYAQSDPWYSPEDKTMFSLIALGIAGAGVALLVKSKPRASKLPSIAPMPKGFVVSKTVQFK